MRSELSVCQAVTKAVVPKGLTSGIRNKSTIKVYTPEKTSQLLHVSRRRETLDDVYFFLKWTDTVNETEVESSRDFVHEPLKSLSGISQTEGHAEVLVQTERCRYCCLRYVSIMNGNLLVRADQVEFRKYTSTSPQGRQVPGCFLGTICSGDAQLLLEGRMIPNRSIVSNSCLAARNFCGGNRRGRLKTGGPKVIIRCCTV
ncbi:LOW QUALITY PROTEIN: hypothetical protein M514_20418 [Trichuris suis]|uniref:Uncharacterized protein n=1 Tax=Trichuris suis TaxID=68888 RepID=A0A085ND36_9BILA|nr:LOW QUALITY PROTEIN: hypothetical protein M514_20418 [Trichuris suis]